MPAVSTAVGGLDYWHGRMSLTRFADDIWTVAAPSQRFSGIRLGTRMTVVKLGDGRLWLHSPIPLTPALSAELRSLGPVAAIVAPNRLHHLYVADCQKAFPEAATYLAPKLAKKRPDLVHAAELGDQPEPLWAADLQQCVLDGVPRFREVVFLHGRSRTLIVTDALFNMGPSAGPLIRGVLRLLGRAGPRPLFTDPLLRIVRNDSALAPCLQRVARWEFDNIIMAHGEPVVGNGQRVFQQTYTHNA